MVIPCKLRPAQQCAKMAPSLRVAPPAVATTGAPGRVARRSFGLTKLRSSRLAWRDFGRQRRCDLFVDKLLVDQPYEMRRLAKLAGKDRVLPEMMSQLLGAAGRWIAQQDAGLVRP